MTRNGYLFPTGFLWGSATSAHQVEGNNTNNQWWAVESQPGAIWHDDKSGLAADWWQNAERDFDLMQRFGMNTHRLSVEWSRIEPRPGEFNTAAIERYRQMLDGLRSRGIRPMLCLHHFANPLWLEQAGGWENAQVIARFELFVRYTVTALRDLCDMWLTINEPAVYVNHSFVEGIFPPRKKNPLAALRVFRHMALAHGAAYRAIHEIQPDAAVGIASALRAFRGLRPGNRLDAFAARLYSYLGDDLWFKATHGGLLPPPLGMYGRHPQLKDAFDFVGINYYTRSLMRFTPNPVALFGKRTVLPGAELSDSGRDGPYSWYAPDGLYDVCREVARFGKPIYITENGLPDADDDQRPRWLLGHLAALHRAIQDGADVRGYYHWTFTDNFEWAEGWGLRFGLVALNPQTQERTPRPSAHLFEAIARSNRIDAALVRQYAPELLPQLFPEG